LLSFCGLRGLSAKLSDFGISLHQFASDNINQTALGRPLNKSTSKTTIATTSNK
jgi:hypothetical protein